MFKNIHRALEFSTFANLSEENYRIGLRKIISFLHRFVDEGVERGFLGRVREDRGDVGGRVGVGEDLRLILAVILSEKIARDPRRFFLHDLLIDVFEKFELD